MSSRYEAPAKVWAGVIAELANRGVGDILIACCDGQAGLPDAIEATFPHATVPTYVEATKG
jgi:putative transposase